MEINKKGRAKYRPLNIDDRNKIKELLLKKIEEEQEETAQLEGVTEIPPLNYKKDKFNVISLFSGCGGLDLGVELAGLAAIIGDNKAMKYFKDRELYDSVREESIFNIIYTNDIFKEANESYKLNFPKVFQQEVDIRKIKSFPKANLVLGGFPCPGFSEAGPRLIDDERNFLYIHFIRCLIQ